MLIKYLKLCTSRRNHIKKIVIDSSRRNSWAFNQQSIDALTRMSGMTLMRGSRVVNTIHDQDGCSDASEVRCPISKARAKKLKYGHMQTLPKA